MDATHGATTTSVGSAEQDLVIPRVFNPDRKFLWRSERRGRHPATGPADPRLARQREFPIRVNAPRVLVFQAWTEPERVMRWGFTAPAAEREMCRQGGAESLDRLAAHLATA